jgi:hypothetical protein
VSLPAYLDQCLMLKNPTWKLPISEREIPIPVAPQVPTVRYHAPVSLRGSEAQVGPAMTASRTLPTANNIQKPPKRGPLPL